MEAQGTGARGTPVGASHCTSGTSGVGGRKSGVPAAGPGGAAERGGRAGGAPETPRRFVPMPCHAMRGDNQNESLLNPNPNLDISFFFNSYLFTHHQPTYLPPFFFFFLYPPSTPLPPPPSNRASERDGDMAGQSWPNGEGQGCAENNPD